MKSRIISSIIAVGYLISAYSGGAWKSVVQVGIFLVLPLSCIWFGDAMGGYTGANFGRGAITGTSPGCMVAFGGWLLLLLPAALAVIMVISNTNH